MEEEADSAQAGEPEGARENQHASQEPAPDLLERVVSWISLLLILSAAGFLIWESTQHEAPPAFQTQVEKVWSSGGRHYLRIGVRNTGGKSVQTLGVQVALLKGGRTVSTSEAELSWLPAQSKRRTTVIFKKDPRTFDVQIQLKGYEEL